MKKHLSYYAPFVLAACFLCGPVRAYDDGNPLRSEEAFQSRLGSRAVVVAPGVYRVELSAQETVEVAFGQQGLDYDRARVQTELATLRSQLSQARNPEDRRDLRRRIAVLEKERAALWEGETDDKAAVTGTVCGDYFVFSLDGGFTPAYMSGWAWGQASISLNPEPQVGPPPPTIPAHRAYSAVSTQDDINNTYSNVDTQLAPEGSGAAAQSSTSVYCGVVFDYPAWISYNWVNAYGCTDGYRRIYRTKVNPN